MANNQRKSFTLIELLVVLALVAILSVVVVMTLNPAELIKQARDSNRLSDLSTINTALNLFSADVTSGFMGTSTVVYVSLPDNASSTCGSWGLPALPSGYTYNCVSTANLRNTNGTGWIPVNFERISSNSPISQLPIDPTNTTTTRLYYTYISGGSWELNASIEASKNKLGGSGDLVSKDGGSASSQYEIGNNLNLNPLETGDSSLVGYWNFEEGPNTTSTDRSGYGNHGTWNGTSTEKYVSGKVGHYSGYFNGSSDYINLNNNLGYFSFFQNNLDFTISVWLRLSSLPGRAVVFSNAGSTSLKGMSFAWEDSGATYGIESFRFSSYKGAGGIFQIACHSDNQATIYDANWHHVVVSSPGPGNNIYFYVDGTLKNTDYALSSFTGLSSGNSNYVSYVGGTPTTSSGSFRGALDDIRIYNRALSATEVLALYNATK